MARAAFDQQDARNRRLPPREKVPHIPEYTGEQRETGATVFQAANERESLNGIFEQAVGAAYEVSNVLGSGFLEKVYERALVAELRSRGLQARPQVGITVTYKGQVVGEYFADIVVEDKLLIELKCADSLANEHMAQCINYLKASGLKLALLLNFQKPRVEWKRIVYGL
jgi:GxxExxY protein